MTPTLRRMLGDEPGCLVDPRSGGECYFCSGALGQEQELTRLFAVAADGGMLLRLPEDVRHSVITRGVAEPNQVLPKWVLAPPQESKAGVAALHPEHKGGPAQHDRELHGEPQDWVWMPIPDPETFERRRPHILETLSYCQYSIKNHGRGSGGDR